MIIRGIFNFKRLNFNNNFILSALNLAFLGFFFNKDIKISRNYIVWPDGLYSLKYGFKKKIPGRNLLRIINLPISIKSITVIGDLANNQKIELYKRYKLQILHKRLPNLSVEKLKYKIGKLNNNSFCIITLPTPKQEQIANNISVKNKNYKILCIGGALKMLLNQRELNQSFLIKHNLEFIFRLKSEPGRRILRLTSTFFYYLIFRIILRRVFKLILIK